jgi:hypothetical protein
LACIGKFFGGFSEMVRIDITDRNDLVIFRDIHQIIETATTHSDATHRNAFASGGVLSAEQKVRDRDAGGGGYGNAFEKAATGAKMGWLSHGVLSYKALIPNHPR